MIPFKLLGTTVALSLASTFGGTFPTSTITISDSSYQQRQVDTRYISNSNWNTNITCFIDISRASYFDQINNSTYFIFGIALNFMSPGDQLLDYIEINLTANSNDYLRLTNAIPSNNYNENDFQNLRSNLNVYLGTDYDYMGYSPRVSETYVTNLGSISSQVNSFTARRTGLSYQYKSDVIMKSESLAHYYSDTIVLVLDCQGQVTNPLMTPSINGSILIEVAEDGFWSDPVYPQTTSIHYPNI